MRAIIQAGGKGSRLRNITGDEIPKPMVSVAGKPLLQWQIELLKKSGIEEIFLIIGYLGGVIRDYFKSGNEYGVSITYIEEKQPLGTAGGLYYLYNQKKTLFYCMEIFFWMLIYQGLWRFIKRRKLFSRLLSIPMDILLIQI